LTEAKDALSLAHTFGLSIEKRVKNRTLILRKTDEVQFVMRHIAMTKSMMIVSTLDELRSARSILDDPVGLVPTMGYLHEGHLSLVQRAKEECTSVAVSIFVNPTQFGPNEDLDAYPRDMQHDLHLLESLGVDLVWTPTPEIMYPDGYQTWVQVEALTESLEGARRPGHFRGVTTVVAKLFNGVQPARAYFGQKDAQQAAVIRRMARDLNFPLEVVVCPTVREPDGLAMSSRNAYLNPEQRRAATVLYRALSAAKGAYEAGERDAEALRTLMRETLAAEPLAEMQYVSCADYDTLQEMGTIRSKALLSMAVFVGKTRLIDNFVLG
jgi:pantoate--beta-alanine ligase